MSQTQNVCISWLSTWSFPIEADNIHPIPANLLQNCLLSHDHQSWSQLHLSRWNRASKHDGDPAIAKERRAESSYQSFVPKGLMAFRAEQRACQVLVVTHGSNDSPEIHFLLATFMRFRRLALELKHRFRPRIWSMRIRQIVPDRQRNGFSRSHFHGAFRRRLQWCQKIVNMRCWTQRQDRQQSEQHWQSATAYGKRLSLCRRHIMAKSGWLTIDITKGLTERLVC